LVFLNFSGCKSTEFQKDYAVKRTSEELNQFRKELAVSFKHINELKAEEKLDGLITYVETIKGNVVSVRKRVKKTSSDLSKWEKRYRKKSVAEPSQNRRANYLLLSLDMEKVRLEIVEGLANVLDEKINELDVRSKKIQDSKHKYSLLIEVQRVSGQNSEVIESINRTVGSHILIVEAVMRGLDSEFSKFEKTLNQNDY